MRDTVRLAKLPIVPCLRAPRLIRVATTVAVALFAIVLCAVGFVALVLAGGPIDFVVRRTRDPGIRILRPAYGIPDNRPSEVQHSVFEEKVIWFGCIVPRNPPRSVVVIDY